MVEESRGIFPAGGTLPHRANAEISGVRSERYLASGGTVRRACQITGQPEK